MPDDAPPPGPARTVEPPDKKPPLEYATPSAGPARTVERILVETILVALAGAFVLAFAWELGKLDIGWTLAIIIWIAGGPLLEIIRLLGARR